MSKIIIKHRRGTTSEWLNARTLLNDQLVNIIPEEGELLVEECEVCDRTDECISANPSLYPDSFMGEHKICEVCGKHVDHVAGQQKLKIGNGVDKFADLPYVTTDVEERIRLVNERLNNLILSSENELTLDNELIDIRVGYDGIPYKTAGEAVRALGHEITDLRKSLAQFIDADAVDGLKYENSILYLTSNGKIIEDSAVEIVSGSGGGASSDIKVKLTNLTPAGTNFSVVSTDTVNIKFKFTSEEDNTPTGDYTCVIRVNGLDRKTIYCKQNEEGETIDITKYLAHDTNSVRLTCTDIYGNTRSIIYNIEVIELAVKSSFNSSIIYDNENYSNGIDIRYSCVGVVTKTVYFELDGKEYTKQTLAASTSGKELSIVIPWDDLSHGCHHLRIYAQAIIDDISIQSNILTYDILAYVKGETAPMIGSTYTVDKLSQGELVSIPYVVFDPNDALCEVRLSIKYMDGDVEKTYSTTTVTVDQTVQTWNTRSYPVNDVVKFSIIYAPKDLDTPIIKHHVISVAEAEVSVNPVNDARLELNAVGRTNSELYPETWTYEDTKYGNQEITTTFNNFNWKSNGWIVDENGDTCLRLSGGAQAVINFAPFHYPNSDPLHKGHTFNINNNGLTFEIDFAIRDVNNRDTIVLDCYSDGKGIQATADTAFIKSSKDTIRCNYKDEERIKLTFTIDKEGTDLSGNETPRFLSVYLNGVLSGILRYTSSDFNQDSYITLGDTGCTLDVYSIRVYDQTLTHREVVNNYIADLTNVEEKIKLFNDNDIYTLAGLLSYEEVKRRIPTITFTGSMPTYKDDKKVVYMDFTNPFDSSKDFVNVYGGPIKVEIDVQGTSSQYYVRKNWKIKLKKKKDGVTVFDSEPYQHMTNEVPSKVFCIKVDYAEGTGTHNTQNANFVETLYDEIIPAKSDDDRVRTTITGFPCVIYERETENDTPVFSSKGNFNFDKGSEEAFGFTEDYDVECWEFCNNTSDSCNFLDEIPRDWSNDFEPRYTPKGSEWEEIEELQELKDSATDSKTNIIDRSIFSEEDEERLLSLRDTVIVEFKKLHDWVVSTKNDITKFKNEFENYFDKHYALIYYVYTFFALMTDQRAKNMFLTRWNTTDNEGNVVSKWYPYFYDNDTSFGINNEGYLVFDYYHEDTDQVDNTNVYNGQNSILWTNFRKAFPNDIRNCYAQLRSDKKLTYEALLDQFINKGSNIWSASIYNEDAEFKYLTMARPENAVDGEINTANLYQVKGDDEPHFKYFVENRLMYCDSKWNAGTYPNDYVLLRINTPSVKFYPTGNIIDSVELTAGEPYRFCVTGSQGSTVIRYSATNDSGELSVYVSDEGFGTVTFIPKETSTYTFTAAETYNVESAGGNYPDNATDEEKEAIDAANDQLQKSLTAVPPDPKITVTPFSNMYCGVKYKANGTLEQYRSQKNVAKTFGENLNEVFNDTETSIFGAKELSSLGNLAGLYCSILDTSNARKLTDLQVGSNHPDYRNTMLREVKVGANKLLKKIDLTNCIRLEQSLDLSNCSNIEEIYCRGTSIAGISLPSAGYIKKMELPTTVEELTITNHPNLTIDNLKIGEDRDVSNIKTLCILNCNQLNINQLFDECLETGNLKKVRINNIVWNNKKVEDLRKLYQSKNEGGYGLKGIDINNLETTELSITGKCTLHEDVSGEVMAELVKYLPYIEFNLELGYHVTSTITFMNDDGTEVLYTKSVEAPGFGSTNIYVDCEDPVLKNEMKQPVKDSSVKYNYNWNGWSIQPSQDRVAQEDALKNILGNRILYPSFSSKIRNYTGAFYTGSTLMYDELVEYENYITFNTDKVTDKNLLTTEAGKLVPKKIESVKPDSYEFTGWLPTDMKILGNTNFFAQFYINEDDYYLIPMSDITYNLDNSNKTVTILSYNNVFEPIAKIPTTYDVENTVYTVTEISGSSNTYPDANGFTISGIEYVDISDSIEVIGKNSFNNCEKLSAINIGKNVQQLQDSCFANCSNLTDVIYNAKEALVNRTDKQNASTYPFFNSGINAGMNIKIGPDVNSIPSYLFHQSSLSSGASKIAKLDFSKADNCTTIGTSAFNLCNIKELKFNDNIVTIGQSAFSTNHHIKELVLPSNIEKIDTSAFEGWDELTTIHIPAKLTSFTGAFRHCPKLVNFSIEEGSKFKFHEGSIIDTETWELILGTRSSQIGNIVRSLAPHAFCGRTDLNTIHIPTQISELPQQTFANCSNLAAVTFDESSTCEFFGDASFIGCSNLQSIEIPESVTTIGTNTFTQSGLKSITLPANVFDLGINPFLNCEDLEEVTFLNPNGIRPMRPFTGTGYDLPKLFNGCKNLKTINVAWSEDTKIKYNNSDEYILIPGQDYKWGVPNPDNVTINFNCTETSNV